MMVPARLLILLTVISLLFAGAVTSLAQTDKPQFDQYGRWINGVSEPWMFPEWISPAEAASVQTKWSAIEADVTRQRDAWAGNYFFGGDTHGTYLKWSAENGFVAMDVDKCAAQVMGFSYGNVTVGSNGIELSPVKTLHAPVQHSHAPALPQNFVTVTWRSRYLVPKNRVADFCDYVAGLGKYNDWAGDYLEVVEFFEKFGSEDKSAIADSTRPGDKSEMDLPDLPAPFRRFLKKPIDVEITQVGKSWRRHNENLWWGDLVIPVTINRGRTEGVTPGMGFRTADGGEMITVTRVGVQRSEANIIRSTRKRPCVKISNEDDCREPEDSPIMVGLKASTSPYRYNK